MNTCSTCVFWNQLNDTLPKSKQRKYNAHVNICTKIDLLFGGETLDSVTTLDYVEGPSLITGPNFGCIHHTPKS